MVKSKNVNYQILAGKSTNMIILILQWIYNVVGGGEFLPNNFMMKMIRIEKVRHSVLSTNILLFHKIILAKNVEQTAGSYQIRRCPRMQRKKWRHSGNNRRISRLENRRI